MHAVAAVAIQQANKMTDGETLCEDEGYGEESEGGSGKVGLSCL